MMNKYGYYVTFIHPVHGKTTEHISFRTVTALMDKGIKILSILD